jgi:ABC-type phosphate/phosphonate transport system substrate-binding protein
MQNLAETINNLPTDLQEKVFDYIEELEKSRKKKKKKLSLKWAGGLREYKDKFTSVELQKKSLDWWSD